MRRRFRTAFRSPFGDGYDLERERRLVQHVLDGTEAEMMASPLLGRAIEYEERAWRARHLKEGARTAVVLAVRNVLHPDPPPLAGLKPRLILRDGECRTTSLAVAEHFGKQHFHVLRDIQRILDELEDKEFAKSNFGLVKESVSYLDSNGVARTKETSRTGYYEITRDGFSLLVMGFTGKAALGWKVRYIKAFNMMEKALREPPSAPRTPRISLADLPAGLPACYYTDVFLVMFHLLAKCLPQSVLLRTLIMDFGAAPGHMGWVKLTARQIIEMGGGAICRQSVYRARDRLVDLGLLKVEKRWWLVDLDRLVTLLTETAAKAVSEEPSVRRLPSQTVTPEPCRRIH